MSAAIKSDPADHVALVTPSDTADIPATRGVSVATAGDMKVTTVGGETVVIPSGALAAGIVHPIRVTRVWATGTAAVGIVAYW
jgi:hypothetical protein